MDDKVIKIECVKDGYMLDSNECFCYKGKKYEALYIEGATLDDEFYYVRDELDENIEGFNHGMDPEFFNEYFVLNFK